MTIWQSFCNMIDDLFGSTGGWEKTGSVMVSSVAFDPHRK
jgi:hypothetical protein